MCLTPSLTACRHLWVYNSKHTAYAQKKKKKSYGDDFPPGCSGSVPRCFRPSSPGAASHLLLVSAAAGWCWTNGFHACFSKMRSNTKKKIKKCNLSYTALQLLWFAKNPNNNDKIRECMLSSGAHSLMIQPKIKQSQTRSNRIKLAATSAAIN